MVAQNIKTSAIQKSSKSLTDFILSNDADLCQFSADIGSALQRIFPNHVLAMTILGPDEQIYAESNDPHLRAALTLLGNLRKAGLNENLKDVAIQYRIMNFSDTYCFGFPEFSIFFEFGSGQRVERTWIADGMGMNFTKEQQSKLYEVIKQYDKANLQELK